MLRSVIRRIAVAGVLLLVAACAAAGEPIHEERYVEIGGIPQWVTIKGDDRKNPVILFLHGGPCDALSPYADSLYAGWERKFTLVQWDRRGAGRTFAKTGTSIESSLTIPRMVQDGIEVATYLTRHLDRRKVILYGGSWGTILGVHMALERPDLFYAYVGNAQVVNWQADLGASYARLVALARDASDTSALEALDALGPPPWHTAKNWPQYRKWLRLYQAKVATALPPTMTVAAEYASPKEQASREAADDFCFLHFWGLTLSGPLTQVDLAALGTRFAVPVFVIQGDQDLSTPSSVTKAYFDLLQAPTKRLILVPATGHEDSAASLNATLKLLTDDVRPLAVGQN